MNYTQKEQKMKDLTLIPFIYSIMFEEEYNEKTIDSAERAIINMVMKYRDGKKSFIVEIQRDDYKEYDVVDNNNYDDIVFSSSELSGYLR
jgi:hypothetical protein